MGIWKYWSISLLNLCAVFFSFGCVTTLLEKPDEYSLNLFRPLLLYFSNEEGVMLNGFDPVAYFTEGKAVEGINQISYEWQGVMWYFSNTDHLNLFVDEPEKYAPRYNGYCAWSVANNNYVPPAEGDPEAWEIVDEKLYVIYDQSVRSLWLMDLENNLKRSEEQWPAKLDLMMQYKPVQDRRLSAGPPVR